MADTTTGADASQPRHLKPAERTTFDAREIGRPGTRLFAGYLSEETNPDLRGTKGLDTYKQMGNDPTVAAAFKVVELPIRSTEHFVEPASEDPDDVYMADMIHHSLFTFGSQSYDDVLRMMTTEPLRYGFQPLEIVWDRETQGRFAGRVMWDKLAYRDPRTRLRWNVEEVDTAGGGRIRRLISMTQQAPPSYEYIDIPASKLLLFVNDQLGENFDGIALCRQMYQPWFIKQQLIRIQAIGLERTYMGLPVATLPEDFTDAEHQAARTIVENLTVRENTGAVHSEAIQLAVLSNKLEGAAMAEAIGFHDGQILEPMLSQFLNLGHTGTGAYSLSEDQSELFLMALNALDNRNESVINLAPGIPTLIDLNFADVDRSRYPKVKHARIGRRDLGTLGRLMQALGQWGFVTPDQPTEDRWREMLELPEQAETLSPEAYKDLLDTVAGAQREQAKAHRAKMVTPAPGVPQDALAPKPGSTTSPQATQLNASERFTPWLRGNVRDHRNRFRAMDMAEEIMGEYIGDVKRMSSFVPEPPSLRLRKNARPYSLIDMSEKDGKVKATIRRVNREAKAGNLKPVTAPHESVVVPRQRMVAAKHEKALRAMLEGKAKRARETVGG